MSNIKTTQKELGDNEITVLINNDILNDCYVYMPLSAPSEIKRMILDAFSVELDKLIMDNRKPNTNLGELKCRLGKVKVIVED